jgi:hypothetical protein
VKVTAKIRIERDMRILDVTAYEVVEEWLWETNNTIYCTLAFFYWF